MDERFGIVGIGPDGLRTPLMIEVLEEEARRIVGMLAGVTGFARVDAVPMCAPMASDTPYRRQQLQSLIAECRSLSSLAEDANQESERLQSLTLSNLAMLQRTISSVQQCRFALAREVPPAGPTAVQEDKPPPSSRSYRALPR